MYIDIHTKVYSHLKMCRTIKLSLAINVKTKKNKPKPILHFKKLLENEKENTNNKFFLNE